MERTITITNGQGLHARPAAMLVEQMKAFDATVKIKVGEKTANGSSIMSVLALGASNGNEALISADGPDAEAAMDAVEAILTAEEH